MAESYSSERKVAPGLLLIPTNYWPHWMSSKDRNARSDLRMFFDQLMLGKIAHPLMIEDHSLSVPEHPEVPIRARETIWSPSRVCYTKVRCLTCRP